MVTVAQFIDSIEHLTAGNKAALKRHVQMDEFGANLDADCDEVFKRQLCKIICQQPSMLLSAQQSS